MGISAVGGARK